MSATSQVARLALVGGLLGALLGGASCAPGQPPVDTGLDGLGLVSLQPTTLVPGSRVILRGRSFVSEAFGETRLRLHGLFNDAEAIDVTLPARFLDFDKLEVIWPGGVAAGLPEASGTFVGEATVEVDSTLDGLTHRSESIISPLDVQAALDPLLGAVHTGVIFVNDPISIEGDGLLLGGDEGQTFAVVEGCFKQGGAGNCVAVDTQEIPVVPETTFDRSLGHFAFAPRIAGIQPGAFVGMVHLVNRHGAAAEDEVRESEPQPTEYDLVPPAVFRVSPPQASLGQYVEITGGGFVGEEPGSPDQTQLLTTLELQGSFTPTGGTAGAPVTLTLVPEFVSGPLLRYVPNPNDDLGQRIDLRKVTGTFQGTVRPVVQYGADSVTGDPTTATLGIAPVKQVVWLHFLPSYVESLRHFGLRAVDDAIRERILEVAQRDYAGVNIDFRIDEPGDFALFAQVDFAGPDPNDLGYLGYDNTPGKDVDNERLYDKIGGVNALTQEGGFPGYGGVFVESFFGFSQHPGVFATRLDAADPRFDKLFDPFRPDRGGRPVVAADIAAGIPRLDSTDGCLSTSDRPTRIACAIYVLGSLIGTTMTHEVGHSLGLANPYGDGFHDDGDQANRLMDAGGARTFGERAELEGEGPAVFCADEYAYLLGILPGAPAGPEIDRPICGF